MTSTGAVSHMALALAEARAAAARGEVPVGASSFHPRARCLRSPETGRWSFAIRRRTPKCWQSAAPARPSARKRLIGCDLYVTLEPCPMCAAAISFARLPPPLLRRQRPEGRRHRAGARVFSQPTCHHVPEIYPGSRGERARVARKRSSRTPRTMRLLPACAPLRARAAGLAASALAVSSSGRLVRRRRELRQRFDRQNPRQLLLQPLLRRLRGRENLVELQEVEHLIVARAGSDQDIGLADFSFSLMIVARTGMRWQRALPEPSASNASDRAPARPKRRWRR